MASLRDLAQRVFDSTDLDERIGQFANNFRTKSPISNPMQNRQPIQPQRNIVSSIGRSPVGRSIVNFQNQIETRSLPRVDLTPFANSVKNPIYKPAAQLGAMVGNELINIPQKLLESGGRGGLDIRSFRAGKTPTPARLVGTAASMADPLFDIATFGSGTPFKQAGKIGLKQAGKVGLMTSLKHGAKIGGIIGATSGGLKGLKEGEEADMVKFVQGVMLGGTIGAGLGAGTAGVGRAIGKIFNAVRLRNPNATEEQVNKLAREYVRDRLGRFTGFKKPKQDVVYVAGTKNKILDRKQPITVNVNKWMDDVDNDLGIDPDQGLNVGLSVKELTPKQRATLNMKGFTPKKSFTNTRADQFSSKYINKAKNMESEPLPWETDSRFSESDVANIANESQVRAEVDNKAFKDIFKKYIGQLDVANTTGTQTGVKFKSIPSEKGPSIIKELESGNSVSKTVGQLHKTFDDLYKQAKGMGLKLGYRENYITHYWKQPAEQIVQDYKIFKQRLGIQNHRQIPTYEEGLKMGLTPKYNNPAQIVTEYARNLEKLKANLEFVKQLKDKRFIVPASIGRRNPGFVPINSAGFSKSVSQIEDTITVGDWYAPKEVATTLNKMFSQENTGLIGSGLDKTAGVSGKMQDIMLSGGIPKTPINAFTLAQTLKETTAGRVQSPIKSLFRSLSNKRTMQYFAKNVEQIKKMQARNVPVRSSFKIENIIDKDTTNRTLGEKAGKVWSSVVNEPTFGRFMPMLQVELFNSIEKQALKQGKNPDLAADIAAKGVKNFYGLTDTSTEALRSKLGNDAASTVLFAPKFRESMINFWVNNLKAFKNPTALENRANMRFIGGALITLGSMNYLNEKFNGHGMLDNPPGKEDKLLIPLEDGTVIGIPFLSSIATIPRAIVRQMLMIGRGDVSTAGRDAFQSYASVALKPIGDVMMNQDYFGKEITGEFDTGPEKLKKQGQYMLSQYTGHPYLKELTDSRNQGDPLYQRATRMTELPIRYYTKESIVKGEFYNDYYKLKPFVEQYEKLSYQDPAKAQEFYSKNQDKIDQFEYMKQVQNEYYDQKDLGINDFSILKDYKLPEGTSKVGDSIVIKQDGGGFKRISLNKQIPEPKLTGFEELDKELLKSYKADIQSRINDYQSLYESGVVSAEEAEGKILELLELKKIGSTAKGKKPTKITFKKVSPGSVKMAKIKKSKAPKIKFSKAPVKSKPKSSKTVKIVTPARKISYKVVGPSKIRGLTKSIKLA